MIDWNRVSELRAEIGEDAFGEVVALFLEEVDELVLRLGQVPPEALADALHFLKGSAWNLGFRDFGALCQDGERLAAAGRALTVDRGLLTARYATAKRAFLAGLSLCGTTGTGRVA